MKQKEKICGVLALRIKKYFKYQKLLVLFFAVFFLFSRVQAAVVINEIMVGEKGYPYNEFVELYNDSGKAEKIEDYQLIKRSASGSTDYYLASSLKQSSPMLPYSYVVIAHPSFWESIQAQVVYSNKSSSITNDNIVILYAKNKGILDAVSMGKAKTLENAAAVNPEDGQSIGRLDGIDTNDNSKDFSVQEPTPGKENEKLEQDIAKSAPDIPKNYSDKIKINEILPYPNDGEEEFIELYNYSISEEDLFGWTLHDASKTGEYKFTKHVMIGAKKYFVIFKSEYGFALNNSGDESVMIRDGAGNVVSEVQYYGSKQGISYDFDGNTWHWSKFSTPGKENIFEIAASIEMKIPNEFFVNVYADFSIIGLGDDAKVTWDFGDGHKSYLQETRHKYLKTGKYAGNVKFSSGSEDVIKNFVIGVEEIPHPKIRIIKINANPKGSDIGKETLMIKNESKKQINLNGWNIATGWRKKFTNHPIKEDVIIKKNKSKEITNEVSSFTLNNSKAEIQLRYPDGKVAQRVKYKSPNKSIAEGEVYQKIKGGWEWVTGERMEKHQSSDISNQKNTTDVVSVIENKEDNKTEKIIVPLDIKRENKVIPINNQNVKIELLKNQPRVSGVETVREIDGSYFFTSQTSKKEHYMIVFFKNIFLDANRMLNLLWNNFLQKK